MTRNGKLVNIQMEEVSGVDHPAHMIEDWIVVKGANPASAENLEGTVAEFLEEAEKIMKEHAGLLGALQRAEQYLDTAPATVSQAVQVLMSWLTNYQDEVSEEMGQELGVEVGSWYDEPNGHDRPNRDIHKALTEDEFAVLSAFAKELNALALDPVVQEEIDESQQTEVQKRYRGAYHRRMSKLERAFNELKAVFELFEQEDEPTGDPIAKEVTIEAEEEAMAEEITKAEETPATEVVEKAAETTEVAAPEVVETPAVEVEKAAEVVSDEEAVQIDVEAITKAIESLAKSIDEAKTELLKSVDEKIGALSERVEVVEKARIKKSLDGHDVTVEKEERSIFDGLILGPRR